MKNLLPFIIPFLLLSCQKKVNLDHERTLIQDILKQERTYHFENNTEGFVSLMADTITAVKNGIVNRYSHADMKARFDPYFGSVKFIRWDDKIPPVIEISDDGSMAYAVVRKEVLLTYPDTIGRTLYDTTHYAWMAIYRKINGEWKGVANASTEIPK